MFFGLLQRKLFFEITVKIENYLNSAENLSDFSENIQLYSKNSGSYMPDIQGCYNKICLKKIQLAVALPFAPFVEHLFNGRMITQIYLIS